MRMRRISGHPDTDPDTPARAIKGWVTLRLRAVERASVVAIESGRRQSRSADADVRDLVRLRTEHWLEREAQAGD